MTEAMSRHEIEDVLSSIRRLVSHDDRAGQAADQSASRSSEKLVLTSALRVDDAPASKSQMSGGPGAPEGAAVSDNVVSAAQPVQHVIQNPASAPDNPPHLTEATGGRTSVGTAQRDSLVSRIARAGQDSAAASMGETPATTGPDKTDPVAAAVTDKALDATLARLEAALSIPAPKAVRDSDSQSGARDEPDMVIDEETLSKMVSALVREELQGELGERITRNIRKLVRAEVARELQMRNT